MSISVIFSFGGKFCGKLTVVYRHPPIHPPIHRQITDKITDKTDKITDKLLVITKIIHHPKGLALFSP
jgi:hypothetical protein